MHPDTTSSSGAPHGGAHAVLRLATLALALVLLTLAGCAQIPHASVVGEQEQIEIPDRPLPVANGSIFQKARGYQPLFEDRRPRSVGDILTIVLDEEVSASKNSRSNADRYGSSSLTFSQVPDGLEELLVGPLWVCIGDEHVEVVSVEVLHGPRPLDDVLQLVVVNRVPVGGVLHPGPLQLWVK